MLRRLWLVLRLVLAGSACAFVVLPLADAIEYGALSENGCGMIVSAAIALTAAFALTPKARGRVHLWLGAVGHASSAQQKATTIACLLGGTRAMQAIAHAAARFRVLPLHAVSEHELAQHLAQSNPTHTQRCSTTAEIRALDEALHALRAKTVAGGPAGGDSPGWCSAFVSHSHRDDAAAKAHILTEWQHIAGEAAAVWLDVACIGKSTPRPPTQRRTSNEPRADDLLNDLLSLPVFMSFCSGMLIIAGPTWSSRLWCCVELFAFVQMGGRHEDITVRRQQGSKVPLVCAARHAKCTFEADRQALLAAIEASFGMLSAFDVHVNSILHDRVQGEPGVTVEMASITVTTA